MPRASGGHLDALVPKMDAAALHAVVHALPAHVRAVNPGLLDDIARKEFLLDDAAAESPPTTCRASERAGR